MLLSEAKRPPWEFFGLLSATSISVKACRKPARVATDEDYKPRCIMNFGNSDPDSLLRGNPQAAVTPEYLK